MTGRLLASFLITFERDEHLLNTIHVIHNQSLAAFRVLIIDNSLSNNVKDLLSKFPDPNISVFDSKGNLGPAGASKIGLERLTAEGFDWIYWGDDDDPPTDPKTFERLLEIASQYPQAGIIGKVGGKFYPNTGRTRVFENSELSPVVLADYVTGGKHMIVSSKVVKAGILPDPNLFFGFEELEFCLRVKDAGFSILVDGQGMMEDRRKAGNLDNNYRWKGKSLGDQTRVNRQYYSVRNMLYILWSRRNFFGYGYFFIKNIAKIFVSIRYGSSYFLKFSKLTLIGIYHHLVGRYGQYISTK